MACGVRCLSAVQGRSLDIVYCYDAFEDDQNVYMLLERCYGGNLWRAPLTSTFLPSKPPSDPTPVASAPLDEWRRPPRSLRPASRQPSAASRQPSAASRQPSAASRQRPAIGKLAGGPARHCLLTASIQQRRCSSRCSCASSCASFPALPPAGKPPPAALPAPAALPGGPGALAAQLIPQPPVPYRTESCRTLPPGISAQRIVSSRIASNPIESHRIVPIRIESYRTASDRI